MNTHRQTSFTEKQIKAYYLGGKACTVTGNQAQSMKWQLEITMQVTNGFKTYGKAGDVMNGSGELSSTVCQNI